MRVDTAAAIVQCLIEDDEFDYELPKVRSEVRILPTDNPREFDVSLITGYGPVYIGTIGTKGANWVPVRVMPGAGRQFRSKLHFFGPTKEEVAMAMIEALRPLWSRIINRKMNDAATLMTEGDAVDPKDFLDHAHDTWDWKPYYELPEPYNNKYHAMVLRDGRVVTVNYVMPGDYIRFKNGKGQDFNMRLEAIPTPPGHHTPTQFQLSQNEREPIEQVWSVHLKLPGRGQSRKVAEVRADRFEDAMQKGKDAADRMLVRLGESDEIDPKDFLDRTVRYLYVVADGVWYGRRASGAVQFLTWSQQRAHSYARNLGYKVYRMDADSEKAKKLMSAWHATGQRISESDVKDFLDRHVNYVYAVWPYKTQPPLRGMAESPSEIWAVFRDENRARNAIFGIPYYFERVEEDDPRVQKWLAAGNEISESSKAEIEKEAAQAEAPASKEQAEAGNYKKGHVTVQGLEIAIENAKGSTRSGKDKDGKPWKVTMPAHYGYIKGTEGKDKDHLDVYIGENPSGMVVFVVNQKKLEGGFDEHKIMIGFRNKEEALDAYDRAFNGDLGPKLRETVVSTTVDKLKEWIAKGNTKKPFQNVSEAVVEALLENVDAKDFAMGADPLPQTWGDLKPGDVLFSPEAGTYSRIEGFKESFKPHYQDASGQVVYDSRPAKLVLYSQFGPAYAYGHFVQRLSEHPKHALFDAHIVDVEDTSDEALWKLVDEEMYRNGVAPERLQADRHRERENSPEGQAARAARDRLNQMMGRPPQE